jgi:hypothetical protein
MNSVAMVQLTVAFAKEEAVVFTYEGMPSNSNCPGTGVD